MFRFLRECTRIPWMCWTRTVCEFKAGFTDVICCQQILGTLGCDLASSLGGPGCVGPVRFVV